MTRFGVELGIRAQGAAIRNASTITDKSMLDYFLVPETHPEFAGVNAFDVLSEIAGKTKNVTLATGIVNVYSRNKKTILKSASDVYRKSGGRFTLGIGTSAPVIIEKLYKMKFEKPLFRMRDYTDYMKKNHDMKVYWAAVGDEMTKLAAQKADGVIFFLRPESEIRRSIKIIKKQLSSAGKRYDKFNIISIRPTYIEEVKNSYNVARMTIANYVGANEFYSRPLERAGYEKQVMAIRKGFARNGLAEAARNVTKKMVSELATVGSPSQCAAGLTRHAERTNAKTVVAGFDLPKDSYNTDFFEGLQSLVRRL